MLTPGKTLLLFLSLLLSSYICAQPAIDEEKVKKGLALMQQMMKTPGDVMKLQAELNALKLNSAEDREMRERSSRELMKMANSGKEQAMKMGGITTEKINLQQTEKTRLIPVKDEARINSILKQPLKEAEIKKFCKLIQDEISGSMDPAKREHAGKLYMLLKEKSNGVSALGAGAIGCYINGFTQQSLYILGKICSEENADATILNNYAALLTNQGLEEGALPLLNYLNRKYPKDPVVLSNIAVAWLGLGDLKTAEKYADTCIRFFPAYAHQAQYVKSIAEESKGNRQGAVEALQKSTGQVFSAEKERQIRNWGGKLSSGYHKRYLPADALGLSKFNFPAFPQKISDAIAGAAEWESFYKDMNALKQEYEEKLKKVDAIASQNSKAQAEALLKKVTAKLNNHSGAGLPYQQMGWWNLFTTLTTDYALKEEEFRKEGFRLAEEDKKRMDKMEQAIRKLESAQEGVCGEGQPCPEKEICSGYEKAYDDYIKEAAPLFEKFHTSYIAFKKRAVNELVYAARYCLDDAEYEKFKISHQLELIRLLLNVKRALPDHAFTIGGFGGFRQACIGVKINPFKNKGLLRFEDIHCPEEWKAWFGPNTIVSTKCNTITLSSSISIGDVGISGSYSEDLLTGKFTNATLEIGAGIGTVEVKGLEIGAEAGAFIEIDATGITDAGLKGTAGVSQENNGQLSAEAQISVMSGKPSFDTKAEMSNLATKIGKQITRSFNLK